ncbi:MAG: hypothetical protein SGILL_000358 [Bacillariaceae sp.]
MEENSQLEEKLRKLQEDLDKSEAKRCDLEALQRTTNSALLVARDNLAVVTTSQSIASRNFEAEQTVQRLQSIWGEIGTEAAKRQNAIKNIERCLEDTCTRELEEALSQKALYEDEIKTLSVKLVTMQKAMGVQSVEDNVSDSGLLSTVERLREQVGIIEPSYHSSITRRTKALNELHDLMNILALDKTKVPRDLQTLLEQNCPLQADQVKSSIDFVGFPQNSLKPPFLSSCESHVRKLRVQKSLVLVRNRELQQEISDLIEEMHLSSSEAFDLVDGFLRRKNASIPAWWDPSFGERALQDMSAKKYIADPTETFSNHLEFMKKSFDRASSCRRSVSDALKSVIERAQKALLDIVGREFDASEAYAGFHDALFRLPALSKDLILSCISEMEALIDGIDAMTQSEIEALTVVWEALKVPPGDRRGFWGDMEKFDSTKRSGDAALFSQEVVTMVKSNEEWMKSASRRASEVYHNLDKKLEKLGGIHKEVEKLRSKQDTKSKILSLDSEIRIMNAKLFDFEEHCGKHRLLTKKTSGGALLKEERFRKQMQSKFSSNLRQLASLLQSWESQENSTFDASLLSDDVRMLLKEPNQMDSWVEERTTLMGLRTVISKTPNKRSRTEIDSKPSSRHASGLTPPRKRQAKCRPNFPAKPPVGRNRVKTAPDGGNKPRTNQGLSDIDTNAKQGKARKRSKTRNSSSLRPFESILSSMTSPTHESDNIDMQQNKY